MLTPTLGEHIPCGYSMSTISTIELKLHQDETESYICGKIFLKKFANDKNY